MTTASAKAAVLSGASRTRTISDIARQAFWTASEAAMVLRCNVRTLRTELRRGTVLGIRIGRVWRVPTNQFGVSIGAGAVARVAEHAHRGKTSVDVPPMSDSVPQPTPSRPFSNPQPHAGKPTLRINLLGRPEIYIDDVRVAELERSNQRRDLIQLLALHREGLSGVQLATLLNMASHRYEEETLDPHYVRTLVWAARDQARKKTGWAGIIKSPAQYGRGAHRYQLPANTICDLWEFQDRLDQVDRLAARGAGTGASGTGPHNRLIQSSMRKVQGLPVWAQTHEDALAQAAALREEALQMYKGDFCQGSANGCLAEAALMIEQRYISSAVEQAGYWRWVALRMQDPERSYSPRIGTPAPDLGEAGEAGERSSDGLCGPMVSVRSSRFIPQLQPGVRAAWREALLNYERVLQEDLYHEEACIRAMECYASLGNARGVGLTFKRYQEALETDLHQVPGPRVILAHDECREMLGTVRTGDRGLYAR